VVGIVDRRLEIWGTRGHVVVKNDYSVVLTEVSHEPGTIWLETEVAPLEMKTKIQRCMALLAADVVESLRSGHNICPSVQDALEVMKIFRAAHCSVENGRTAEIARLK
jgi:hypothetical protein